MNGNNYVSKYVRGDVWYIKLTREDGDSNQGSSVQRKSRPYLIVSNKLNNIHAPIINVVPIATMDEDKLPMHVYYEFDGRHQVVECEQITTLSVIDFERSESKYMYSFTDEMMERVNKALSCQLELNIEVTTINTLNSLIDKLIECKRKSLDDQLNKVHVSEIFDKLNEAFSSKINNSDNTEKISRMPEVQTVLLNDTNDNNENNKIINSPKRNHSWSVDKMKQFLNDLDELSYSDISKKYGISLKSIPQYKHNFKGKLGMK